MIYELKDTSKVKELFTGAVDSLVTTCLEGMMDSKIYVTDLETPKSAMAYLAEFAFFAGEPNRELASFKPKGVVGMVPYSEGWARLIEECQPDADKVTRYAIKKVRSSTGRTCRSWWTPCPRGTRSNGSTGSSTTSAWT